MFPNMNHTVADNVGFIQTYLTQAIASHVSSNVLSNTEEELKWRTDNLIAVTPHIDTSEDDVQVVYMLDDHACCAREICETATSINIENAQRTLTAVADTFELIH